jgi:dynactin complex subunit
MVQYRDDWEVGKRYLNARDQPLTLKHVGSLAHRSGTWYGIEYDDPSLGRHSGVYEGTRLFYTRRNGSGSFIKGGLKRGVSLIEAIEDKYGPLDPGSEELEDSQTQPREPEGYIEKIVLGSSNNAITVEAPNIDQVQKRVGKLEKLREIGLEKRWINGLGGSESKRALLRNRLKGEPLGLTTVRVWMLN